MCCKKNKTREGGIDKLMIIRKELAALSSSICTFLIL